jgi:hypothetical protein
VFIAPPKPPNATDAGRLVDNNVHMVLVATNNSTTSIIVTDVAVKSNSGKFCCDALGPVVAHRDILRRRTN